MFQNLFYYTLVLIALFVGGCVFNHMYHITGDGDGFQRLYAFIPFGLWFAAGFTKLRKAN